MLLGRGLRQRPRRRRGGRLESLLDLRRFCEWGHLYFYLMRIGDGGNGKALCMPLFMYMYLSVAQSTASG